MLLRAVALAVALCHGTGHAVLAGDGRLALLDNATTIAVLQQRIKDLELEVETLRQKARGDDEPTCKAPAAPACLRLLVSAPKWPKVEGDYVRIGTIRGRPHFSTLEGTQHLYFYSTGADTLWVLSDLIEVSFRAKVLSFAESPDLVREEWKGWGTSGWQLFPSFTISCTLYASVQPDFQPKHQGCVFGKLFEGFCYQAFKVQATWEAAERMCVEWGGHLVSVHSPREEQFIRSLVGTKGDKFGPFWVGVDPYSPEATPVKWSDGSVGMFRSDFLSELLHKSQPEPLENRHYICKKPVRWRISD